MENKYLEKFKTFTEEDLLNAIYFISGNEEIFWLSIEMLTRANIAKLHNCSTFLTDNCGKEAQEQINRLIRVGFMDNAHKAILFQYTGLVAGNIRY